MWSRTRRNFVMKYFMWFIKKCDYVIIWLNNSFEDRQCSDILSWLYSFQYCYSSKCLHTYCMFVHCIQSVQQVTVLLSLILILWYLQKFGLPEFQYHDTSGKNLICQVSHFSLLLYHDASETGLIFEILNRRTKQWKLLVIQVLISSCFFCGQDIKSNLVLYQLLCQILFWNISLWYDCCSMLKYRLGWCNKNYSGAIKMAYYIIQAYIV